MALAGNGNDSLIGSAGKDSLNSDGKDVIYGFEKNDMLKISGTFSASYNKSKNINGKKYKINSSTPK